MTLEYRGFIFEKSACVSHLNRFKKERWQRMIEIQELLNAASRPGFQNRLKLEEVKVWLAEYLAMHEAEIARFPSEQEKLHWDLIAADFDSANEAQFLAALFSGDWVTLLAGLGPSSEVREFADRSFPEDPNEILDELARRFRTGERRIVNLGEIIRWVQH